MMREIAWRVFAREYNDSTKEVSGGGDSAGRGEDRRRGPAGLLDPRSVPVPPEAARGDAGGAEDGPRDEGGARRARREVRSRRGGRHRGRGLRPGGPAAGA